MRKSMHHMVTAFLLLSLLPLSLKAAISTGSVPIDTTKAISTTETHSMTLRLAEINAMDKTKLTAPEKRQLRKEARSIKKHASANGGGVYISVGALLIVILLLILLL